MTALPRTITLEQVGELTYDKRFQRYEASVEFRQANFVGDISMDVESPADLAIAKSKLIEAVNVIGALVDCATKAAVDQLLTIYNDGWRGENPELTGPQFSLRLEPCSLWVDEDKEVGLSLATDGMFPGHAIRVDFDESLTHGTAVLW